MYNTIIGNQQTHINSTKEVFEATQTTIAEKTEIPTSSNLSLSTRSQKLNAISSEFFNGKAFSSIDTTKLIDRVYEYGLISKSEYNTLNESTQNEGDSEAQESTSTASLQQFIDQFKERMGKVDGFDQSTQESVVALKPSTSLTKLTSNVWIMP